MNFFITSYLCNRWVRYTAPIRRYPLKKKGFVPSLVKICPLALEVQAYNPAVALYFFWGQFYIKYIQLHTQSFPEISVQKVP